VPTVAEIETAIGALTPRQLAALSRRMAARSEELADLVAHQAALKAGDFKPWTDVKRELHALHGLPRQARAKIS
jgi:predicted ATPase